MALRVEDDREINVQAMHELTPKNAYCVNTKAINSQNMHHVVSDVFKSGKTCFVIEFFEGNSVHIKSSRDDKLFSCKI